MSLPSRQQQRIDRAPIRRSVSATAKITEPPTSAVVKKKPLKRKEHERIPIAIVVSRSESLFTGTSIETDWTTDLFRGAGTNGLMLIAVYNTDLGIAGDPPIPTLTGADLDEITQVATIAYDAGFGAGNDERLTVFSAKLTAIEDSGVTVSWGSSQGISDTVIVFAYGYSQVRQSDAVGDDATTSLEASLTGARGPVIAFFRAFGQVGGGYVPVAPLRIIPNALGQRNAYNLGHFWTGKFSTNAPSVATSSSDLACAMIALELS